MFMVLRLFKTLADKLAVKLYVGTFHLTSPLQADRATFELS